MLTTNRGVTSWGSVFGDEMVAAAMLDRLLDRSVVMHLDGDSYRLRSHHAQPRTCGKLTAMRNEPPPDHDNMTTTTAPPVRPACPVCWTTFQPVSRQRFCSRNCRKTAWARTQAAPRPLVLLDHSHYRWRKDPVSQRDWDDAHVIDVPLSLHEDYPTLAQRRLSPRCGRRCQVLGTFLHST